MIYSKSLLPFLLRIASLILTEQWTDTVSVSKMASKTHSIVLSMGICSCFSDLIWIFKVTLISLRIQREYSNYAGTRSLE
jgi:hypothetical protein